MLQEVQKKQGIASNPKYSIWTSASAGSGKTTVLVKRLLRMFLTGIQPSKILCITFTNTGAAEMRNRINSKLAEWATLSDDELENEISKLEEGSREGISEKLKTARSLFAKILDYSNDFKILTIHSFCQQIIKRFPLEANIIPNFKIADEILSTELLLQAKDEILKVDDIVIKDAIKYVFTYKNEEDFLELLKQTINQKDNLLYLKSRFFTIDGVIDEVRRSFKIGIGESVDGVIKEFVENTNLSLFTSDVVDVIKDIGKKTDLNFVNSINFFKTDIYKYISAYLTGNNTIRKSIITKAISDKYPEILDFVNNEAVRVFEFKEKLSNIYNFEFTSAFLRITYCVFDIYAKLKKENGYLDYSDLIFETSRLLSNSKYRSFGGENIYSSWINYKLDEGLDHLLIDEAQDTSPIQWDIVKSITEEFFAGYGQKGDQIRTIFVVGDEKQSIFSFQGAEPANFNLMLKYYKEKIESAGKNFEKIYLETSFRSLKSILNVADVVFSEPSRKMAITKIENSIKHNVVRNDGLGKVEIWPLIAVKNDNENETEKKSGVGDWQINYLENIELTAKQELAEVIADQIESWFKKGKVIYSRKDKCLRKIRYSDIMILVKNRDKDFINYLIRQFNRRNIRSMGNDKFNLLDNIISNDIISLFKFILFNEDDLSLANIVKSPFLSLTEDDLYELCDFKNTNNCSLWEALKSIEKFSAKKEILEDLIDKIKSMSIYEFIFYIFETKGFRIKFKERFPYIADEVINEFLSIANNYESNHNNSTLLNFVYFLENSDLEIKRDMEQSSNEIRIMTIHSSKGLESPIIILPDTNHATNTIYKIDKVLNLKEEGNDYTIPLLQKENSFFLDAVKEKMKNETEEEYLRLLYVAITRAENELYICDSAKSNKSKENCWYEILRQAVENIGAKKKKIDNIDGDVLYIGDDDVFDLNIKDCVDDTSNDLSNNKEIENILSNISKNKEKIGETRIINPSTYYAENSLKNPHENSINIEKGTMVHKLLEILPDTSKNEWGDIIDIYLKDKEYKDEIKEITLKVLNNKDFEFLFSKNSKAEVPIFGNVGGDIISGQIDRLAIIDDVIYIVDYKNTNHLPNAVPEKYKKQLELYKKLLEKIYKNKTIKMYILWTSFGKIEEVKI